MDGGPRGPAAAAAYPHPGGPAGFVLRLGGAAAKRGAPHTRDAAPKDVIAVERERWRIGPSAGSGFFGPAIPSG
ncbi:hypothetical protein GCM10027570_35650 [Streptomonospora sediminis]